MTAADRGRVAAERRGRTAEALCAVRLRLTGHRILARRFRTAAGEIDIVARRGRTVVFVEVKQRADGGAVHAVTAAQRRRIARAAEGFFAMRRDVQACDMRFDVMTVTGRFGLPRHLRDAWRP